MTHPMLTDPAFAALTLVVYVEPDYGVVSVADTAGAWRD